MRCAARWLAGAARTSSKVRRRRSCTDAWPACVAGLSSGAVCPLALSHTSWVFALAGKAEIAPASKDEVLQLSMMLNRKNVKLRGDPRWFGLFKWMDEDGSGQVCFSEFAGMVREYLKVSLEELSESALKAAWLALDKDGSGFMSYGEFGGLMRQGERALQEQTDGINASTAAVEPERPESPALTPKPPSPQSGKPPKSPRSPRSPEPASKEEVQALSEQLNRKLCELIKDPRERTWFKLFYHADSNGSRQISFKEFSAMIRDELRIAPKELPDRQIKAAWLALDKNGSGFISAGEFGGMMRRGEHVQAGFVEQKAPWQQRVHSQRWQKAEEVRQTMDRLFHRDLKASMAGAPRATPEELYELSVALNKKMHELQQKKDAGVPIVDPRTDTGAASGTAAIGRDTGNAYTGTVAWFKLFRHMDDDGSGQISYAEFSGMIREELLITPSDIPERRLKAAWLALDTDCSGLINSGEFGAFMRLGEIARIPPDPWALRRQLAEKRRAEVELELVRAQREKLSHAYRVARDRGDEAADLRREAFEQALKQVMGRLASGFVLGDKEKLLLDRARAVETSLSPRRPQSHAPARSKPSSAKPSRPATAAASATPAPRRFGRGGVGRTATPMRQHSAR